MSVMVIVYTLSKKLIWIKSLKTLLDMNLFPQGKRCNNKFVMHQITKKKSNVKDHENITC